MSFICHYLVIPATLAEKTIRFLLGCLGAFIVNQ